MSGVMGSKPFMASDQQRARGPAQSHCIFVLDLQDHPGVTADGLSRMHCMRTISRIASCGFLRTGATKAMCPSQIFTAENQTAVPLVAPAPIIYCLRARPPESESVTSKVEAGAQPHS